jgi:nitroreductase
MFQQMIEKAVNKSQHCQRNWDLSKQIPDRDLKTIETAITACPSKQNYVFYTPYMVTNRDTIGKLYDAADGFALEDGSTKKNSQLLANLVVIFVKSNNYMDQLPRNKEVYEYLKTGKTHPSVDNQTKLAVGIASGYLNLTASLLGYSTGCCTCFDRNAVAKILGIEAEAYLMMGVGIPDSSRPRREHHKEPSFTFPTFTKNLEAVKIS